MNTIFVWFDRKAISIAILFALMSLITVALAPKVASAYYDINYGIKDDSSAGPGAEEAAKRYEESIKSYSPSPTPSTNASESESGGVTKTESTRSTESSKTTNTPNKSDKAPDFTPYIAGGAILLVIAAGAGLLIVKRRKK